MGITAMINFSYSCPCKKSIFCHNRATHSLRSAKMHLFFKTSDDKNCQTGSLYQSICEKPCRFELVKKATSFSTEAYQRHGKMNFVDEGTEK